MALELGGTDESEEVHENWEELLLKRRIVSDLRDVFGKEMEEVSPEQSIGRVSAEVILNCPPGYPTLIHGERILQEHLMFIKNKKKIKVVRDE